MALNTGSLIIPKFDGSNYALWSKKMKPILISRDMWHFVTTGYPKVDLNDTNTTAAQKKEYYENLKKDNETLSLIFCAVEDHIFPHICEFDNSKAAWEMLRTTYEGGSNVKLQNLRRTFETFQMLRNENVSSYTTRLQELVNQIRTFGDSLPEEKVIEKMLRNMQDVPKYEMLATAIEVSKDLSKLTVQELTGYLLTAEEKKVGKRVDEGLERAFATKLHIRRQTEGSTSQEGFRGRQQNFRGRSRGRSSFRPPRGGYFTSFRGRSRGRSTTTVQCSYCKRFGHLERDCFTKQNDLRRRQTNFAAETSGRRENLFLTALYTETQDDKWFIDCGCSTHMTSKIDWFSELEKLETNEEVVFADNNTRSIAGKGVISIHNGDKTQFIHDVLHVPELKRNLLSVGQMLQQKYRLEFDDDQCIIKDKLNKNKVVAKGKMTADRLFTLQLTPDSIQSLAVSVAEDSKLWHFRLGHLNYHSMLQMQSRKMVFGLPDLQKQESVCEECVLGKHHREPF